MLRLRWRLSLLFASLLALVLAGIAFLTYFEAESLFVGHRAGQSREVVYWAVAHVEPLGVLRAGDLNSVADKLSSTPAPDLSFFLLDAGGSLIRPLGLSPRRPEETYIPVANPSLSPGGKETTAVVSQPNRSYRTLVYITPVFGPSGSILGAVQVQARLDEADTALAHLRRFLFFSLCGLFVAACALFLVLGRIPLEPLEELGRISRAVAEGDFGQRVSLPPNRDELQTTVLAFNQMLDNVQVHLVEEKRSRENVRQFLADASHELKSPITILRGFVDVLLRGAKDDPKTLNRSLEHMRATLESMTRLTDELLTLSRLEAGIPLTTGEVEINSLCQGAIETYQVLAQGRKLTFRPFAGPVTLQADPELIGKVLHNLLDNAIRHTQTGGNITVSIGRAIHQVSIAVEDDGEGIAPEHVPHIFERFYQGSKSRSGSAGLGLAIARAAVEAHGGRVAVESAPGRGSKFTVTLPLSPAG